MSDVLNSVPSKGIGTDGLASYHRAVTYVRPRLLAAVLTVVVMLLLKRHYSLATADQLDWILAPTATLVSWLTSANLILERGVGYVDFANGIIVAPACAGVNFMIMAFGLGAFFGIQHMQRQRDRLAWLILALSASYCLALMVNTMRIALSMALYQADIYTGWLTVTRVHRVAGVGLYFGVLWLYFLGLRKTVAYYRTHSERRPCPRSVDLPGWMVLGWYLLIAVGLPLAHRAWQQGASSLVEHCATVVVASLGAWLVLTHVYHLSKAVYSRVSQRE